MKQKELYNTFMMILNWKKPFGLQGLYKILFQGENGIENLPLNW